MTANESSMANGGRAAHKSFGFSEKAENHRTTAGGAACWGGSVGLPLLDRQLTSLTSSSTVTIRGGGAG